MPDYSGQQFGNYRLLRLIGQGGFAEVYLGEHVRLGMKSALKILHTHLMADEDIAAFQQEARTIAELRHAHIIRILDFDVQQGQPFLVLDYAPYGSLRQRHARGSRVPLAQVVEYVTQIADALQYAHDRRLIHRDIKPENMLIGEQGKLLLGDFGIATIAHATSSMRTESSLGTLAFMAPEQLQGKPRPASDQYALAVTVYLWLTGNLPFQGSSTEIIAQHLSAPPPALRASVPEVSPALEQVVQTALAKDPARRFRSVQEFARAFVEASQQTNYQPPLAPTLPANPAPFSMQPAPVADPPSAGTEPAKLILPGRSDWMQEKPRTTQPPVPQPVSSPQPAVSSPSPVVQAGDEIQTPASVTPRRNSSGEILIGLVTIILINGFYYLYGRSYSGYDAVPVVFLMNCGYSFLLALLMGLRSASLKATLFLSLLTAIVPPVLLVGVGLSYGNLSRAFSPWVVVLIIGNIGVSIFISMLATGIGHKRQADARSSAGEVVVPASIEKIATRKQLGKPVRVYSSENSLGGIFLFIVLVALVLVILVITNYASIPIINIIILVIIFIVAVGFIIFDSFKQQSLRSSLYLYQDGLIAPTNRKLVAYRWEDLKQQIAPNVWLTTTGTHMTIPNKVRDVENLYRTINQHLARAQSQK
ncbi:hypothetical protein KDA_43760 [Dictyobacter alpinus]|uniref:non-specific serine/threonine protein kinase n=1 Tax=Dictyobacter alpinus TaxID=2014873 RepID=A0A402BC75_9CHLR|nr:serine/threonine-protein kinase [Dictyobacter alpinus]GCE28892.1 hypothetical protein KDA_43760 [Dictyobacter alpinus]